MDKSWIIVTNPADAKDVFINLNYVSKIDINHTTFRVIFYQGVGTVGSSGSTQAITFVDDASAMAFYVQVCALMKQLDIITDLRPTS